MLPFAESVSIGTSSIYTPYYVSAAPTAPPVGAWPGITSASAATPAVSWPVVSSATTATPAVSGFSITVASIQSVDACNGQTLNVPNASLNWWYNATVYDAVSTISALFGNSSRATGWTVLPATTSFDLTSALATPSCSSSLTFDTQYNTSLYSVTCVPAATQVAAQTTVITQTAFQSPVPSAGNGTLPSVVATPAPPVLTVPDATGTFGQGTAFVFFSTYELVTRTTAQHPHGGGECVTYTNTYPMASPYSFAYQGPDVNSSQVVNANVTGDLDPDFLSLVNASSAVAGSWAAVPTVAIVVQQIFAAVLQPKKQAIIQISDSKLQTVTPTMPQFLTPFGPPPTQFPFPPNIPHHETSAHSLDLPSSFPDIPTSPTLTSTPRHPSPTMPFSEPETTPMSIPQTHTVPEPSMETPTAIPQSGVTTLLPFVGGRGSKKITLEIPVASSMTVVTALYSNSLIITATRAEQVPEYTLTMPSPTNALEVLSEALETMTASVTTATAVSGSAVAVGTSSLPASQPLSRNGTASASQSIVPASSMPVIPYQAAAVSVQAWSAWRAVGLAFALFVSASLFDSPLTS